MKSYIFKIALLLFVFSNCTAKDKATITVSNPTDADRTIETVEVEWAIIAAKGFEAEKTIVQNAKGEEIPSQVVYGDNGEAEYLLFQTQIAAKGEAKFSIVKGQAAEYPTQVYATVAASRYNDFIWENNVIGFRLFHADLIPIDGPSGGQDVWSKRTEEMVIEEWLGHMDYHKDHGKGCDFYKVGPSLGAGGYSLLEDGKMKLHTNFTDAKITANGPIRIMAELAYPDQTIDGKTVSATKKMSFDANSSFTRFDVTFTSELEEIPLVTGLIKRTEEGQIGLNEAGGCLMYWEPEHAPNGHQGLAIIAPEASLMGTLDKHLVAYSNATPGEAFTFYTGACWDKAGYYSTAGEWKAYIKEYKQKLQTPLQITVD